MSVVANIAINVDSTKAVSQLNAVDRAADGLSSNTGKLQQAFGGLNTALAGLGLGALIKDLTGVGIDADRTGKRIQNLAGPTGEAGKLLDIASRAAKSFGLSNLEAQKGVADLYGRLQPTGVALKDIETVYNGVNKAALAAGLSNADTSGVFLQLSQALGSGALQGDELRSIMERMPAVGQAVAKVMGVTVGEVKKLGSEGKITTEIMIKAAAELDKLTPPPPDAFKQFNAAMEDLRVELGENILPLLTPFVNLLLGVVKAFSAMPEPLQTVIVALGLIVTAILAIGTAAAFLAPVIAAFKTLAVVIGGLNIGGLIAGWLPAVIASMSGIVAALGTLLTFVTGTLIPGLIALFSGPVGWTILAVAAVVAMAIAFREPLTKFATWLASWGKPISKFFSDNVTTPISKAWQSMVEFLPKAMNTAATTIKSVFTGVGTAIKAVLNSVLRGVFGAVNGAIENINRLIRAANNLSAKVGGPELPTLPTLNIPQFAKGGVVTGPTLALVGEAGPEYIIPASKMAAASANYLGGARGGDVIPAFANGGYVGALASLTRDQLGGSAKRPAVVNKRYQETYTEKAAKRFFQSIIDGTVNSPGGGKAQINITTGPVMEFDGEKYVTMTDMEKAMRQTADGVYKSLRTPAGRYATGVR
jgi:tape measure domain-containing protein